MNVKSDDLLLLRGIRDQQPALAPLLSHLPHWTILCDANALIQDVCRVARHPHIRTALQELVASGTVRVLTTSVAAAEVERHLSQQAARLGCEPAVLHEIWVKYQDLLRVVTPTSYNEGKDVLAIRARDPHDEHLIAAALNWNVDGILSDDKDLSVTSIPVFRRPVLLSMRDVARHEASAHAPVLGGCAVELLLQLAMRLPKNALFVLGVVAAVALMVPDIRKQLSLVGIDLLQNLAQLMQDSEAARTRSQLALAAVAGAGVRVSFQQSPHRVLGSTVM